MQKIKVKIDGKLKEFKKTEFTLQDNITAMKYQIAVNNYYATGESNNPENYEKMQLLYLEMIAELYGNEFSVEELLASPLDQVETLENIFNLALGGKVEKDTEKKG